MSYLRVPPKIRGILLHSVSDQHIVPRISVVFLAFANYQNVALGPLVSDSVVFPRYFIVLLGQ